MVKNNKKMFHKQKSNFSQQEMRENHLGILQNRKVFQQYH